MREFVGEDLAGASFRQVRLFEATFRQCDLGQVRARGVWFDGLQIDGDGESLVVNGVDVVPLVEAELDRRDPQRAVVLRPVTADDHRAAWAILEELWTGTIDHARALPPGLLHESVNGEWSFVETLRHLVYATETWLHRVQLGEPTPWHPMSLPFDELPDEPGVVRDRTLRPTLDEVLAVRADRASRVRQVLDALTDESLAAMTEPVAGPGYPPPDSYPVAGALRTILQEEWHHRLFAERDLALLEAEL